MNCLPFAPYVILLLDSVLGSLLAPVNLSINSLNFHHVLRWDPGPGTPPGTLYKIIKRVNKRERPQCTNRTSVRIRLPRNVKYALTVQASCNQSVSPESSKLYFYPYRETTIGPPEVSLTGGGSYILINISLPVAQKIMTRGDLYPRFEILWKKSNTTVAFIQTEDRLFNLTNLQIGTEYCVQVHTKITGNDHTTESAWNCAFTSSVEPREPVEGAVAASLILAIGVLMSSLFCLHYTGYLCKLNALPRVLHDAVHLGHTLTPEKTTPDNISISAGVEKQRNFNNPRTPQPATRDGNSDEEDEVEEEEEEHVYMDRDVELSSGESPCKSSVDVSGNSKVAASGGSGSLTGETEVQDTKLEVEVTHGCLDQNEDKAEGAKVSLMPEVSLLPEVHVTVEEDEVKERVSESSGNINLFSVTLAALAVCEEGLEEEEEENTGDSLADFFSDVEPLLPADSKWTLTHRDSQTESDDQTTVALMLHAQDFTATGSEGRHAHSLSCDGEHEETQEEEEEEEEEDEEEEFSGYMRHT
ncbi:interleukin-20 receptor subunit alpha isoform X2 [Etheostoma spectabile]|uniref:interleukin-20 receptor subunit alpha isoform X2 n=1 Tax=Etheostoma spectabile TaxID=54343 RepID=UPI0013AF6417|nr:interleukin-20 receptor subunit alpha-like isoform X2 [Etheostoma spectabile]